MGEVCKHHNIKVLNNKKELFLDCDFSEILTINFYTENICLKKYDMKNSIYAIIGYFSLFTFLVFFFSLVFA